MSTARDIQQNSNQVQTSECKLCILSQQEVKNIKTLYEDEEMKAIFYPTLIPGHIALLPKQHYPLIMNVPEEVVYKMFVVAQKLCTQLIKETAYQGFTLVSNNGVDQAHPHFSLHILPRTEGDGLNFIWQPQQVEEAALALVEGHLKGKVAATQKEERVSEILQEYPQRLP